MNKFTLAGIGTICFWSTLAFLITHTGTVPGLLLAAITFSIGGVCILSIEYFRTRQFASFFFLPLRTYLFGITGLGIYSLLLYTAFKLTSPFLANCLNYLWPLLLTLFLAKAQARHLGLNEIIGTALGFAGTVMIFATRFETDGMSFSALDILGCFLALLAAIIWAGYSTLAKDIKYPAGSTGVFFLAAGIIAAVLSAAFEHIILPTGQEWFFVIVLAVGRLSYTVWDQAMKHGDQSLLSSLSYLIPLASTGWLVLDGSLPGDTIAIVAGLAIIAGCLVTNFQKIRKGLRI